MRLTIRQLFFGGWCWDCPVCHYGDDIPWREVPTYEAAWVEVEAHVALHLATGKRPEWIPVAVS